MPNNYGITVLIFLLSFALASAEDYIPGTTYFGRNNYIEYRAGNLPVIISAPHGGDLIPTEIPDRTAGTLASDGMVNELVLAVADAITATTGYRAHVILCHLHRAKLDCNREIVEGAAGNIYAEQAWHEFHGFIDTASAICEKNFGQGLYFDLHGHAHAIARLEIGYGLTATTLALADSAIAPYWDNSYIRALADSSSATFAEILRGSNSMGGLMQEKGFPSVPSPQYPNPGIDPYFNGGFDAGLHGSREGGSVSSMQIECPYAGVRDTPANRAAFGQALSASILAYLSVHAGIDVQTTTALYRMQALSAHQTPAMMKIYIRNRESAPMPAPGCYADFKGSVFSGTGRIIP